MPQGPATKSSFASEGVHTFPFRSPAARADDTETEPGTKPETVDTDMGHLHRAGLSSTDSVAPVVLYSGTLRILDCALGRSFPKKVHQLSVHLVRVCPSYAVRSVPHHR